MGQAGSLEDRLYEWAGEARSGWDRLGIWIGQARCLWGRLGVGGTLRSAVSTSGAGICAAN